MKEIQSKSHEKFLKKSAKERVKISYKDINCHLLELVEVFEKKQYLA